MFVCFFLSLQLIGKIEKIQKSNKDSPPQKPEMKKTEKSKQSDGMHHTKALNRQLCNV